MSEIEGDVQVQVKKKKNVKKPIRFKIENFFDLSSKGLLHYVKNLLKHINLQNKKLKKMRYKLKKMRLLNKFNSVLTTKLGEEKSIENTEQTVDNFVQDIKNAAEQVQNSMGFVFEPTSGLYYDAQTGYYYNAEYGLYYDGNTGTYYKYDQEKNEFEFHSQVATEKPEVKTKDVIEKSSDNKEKDDMYENRDNPRSSRRRSHDHVRDRRNKTYYSSDEDRHYDNRRDYRSRNRDRRHSSPSDDEYHRSRKTKKSSSRRKKYRSRSRHSLHRDRDTNGKYIREDGELSSCESTNDVVVIPNSESDSEMKIEDIAKKYPPSLRLIVFATNLSNLKIGTLYIVTYIGGTLGREGDHDVIIPDTNVSKCHLKFVYNGKKATYQCSDLGSRNGTMLNGIRMSTSKQESEYKDLIHGSIINVNGTKLLCHVHDGNSTCDKCEPGLIMSNAKETSDQQSSSVSHKEELKRLQKRYGLENEKYVEKPTNSGNFNDRADTRRKKVGSSHHSEKTQAASLNQSIPSENKGFKMLSKLGWSEGQSLGKTNEGITEPIPLQQNEGTKGLGSEDINVALNAKQKKKSFLMKKTQERYNSCDIFEDKPS